MDGGGGVACSMQRWSRGDTFVNTGWAEGLQLKNPKLSAMAWFRAASGH
jgi:hypothetical protein